MQSVLLVINYLNIKGTLDHFKTWKECEYSVAVYANKLHFLQGAGDVDCHFKVERNLESGAISLESARNRGIYVGLLPDGHARPVVHTGESNILFYPQVIKCM